MSVQPWLRQERAVHMLVAVILTLVILAGCGGNEAPKEPTPTLPVALRCEGWQSWLQEIDPEIEAIVDILNHMVDDPAPSEDTYKYWEATLRDLSDEVKDSNPPPAFAKYAKTVKLAADTGEGAAIDLRAIANLPEPPLLGGCRCNAREGAPAVSRFAHAIAR